MKLISKKYRIVSVTNQLQLRYSCLEYLFIFIYLFIYLRPKSVHICTHTQKKKKEISTLKDAQ